MVYVDEGQIILDDAFKINYVATFDCNFTKLEIDIDKIREKKFDDKFYMELGYYIMVRIRSDILTRQNFHLKQ